MEKFYKSEKKNVNAKNLDQFYCMRLCRYWNQESLKGLKTRWMFLYGRLTPLLALAAVLDSARIIKIVACWSIKRS
jgi:hypothetical protein